MLKNLTIQGIGVAHRRALEDLVAAVVRLDRGASASSLSEFA